MDAEIFDRLVRALTGVRSRRGLLSLLAGLPLVSTIATLLPDEADAAGRRKRRKKRHKHQQGDGKDNRNGKEKGDAKGKHKCTAEPVTVTCAGQCATVSNTCGEPVDCGSCACDPACGVCFICQDDGATIPAQCVVDPAQQGEPCGATGQVCQPDGRCVCVPVDPCTGEVCGVVPNNCGKDVACAACPPVIASFTATPTTIDRGAAPPETAMLRWATAGAATCAIDHGVGSVPCTGSISVGPDATTPYTFSATGPGGGPVTAQATVTVQYCHALSCSEGACPSGATQFCESVPIVATSSAQAQTACNICYGVGDCFDNSGFWLHHGPVTLYYYSDQFSPICMGITHAGDIANPGACPPPPFDRWAP